MQQGASRRLTTVLACDVVSYTLLTSQNEERAVRLVRQRFATVTSFVAQHDGRIFNTAGDSVLAEFSSPVEAVRCALEIQEAMKTANNLSDEADRLVLRIGINLGDVMTAGSDLLGDGVNIAARLEGLAPPGGVCVSGTVYEQIRGKLMLEAEDLGEKQVKNIPRPIRAFNLIPGKILVAAPKTTPAAQRKIPAFAIVLFIAVFTGFAGLFILRDKLTLFETTAQKSAPAAAPVGVSTAIVGPSAPASGGAPSSPQMPTSAPTNSSPVSAARPLVPEDVPFIDDRDQNKLRSEYLPARDSKAVAIATLGYYGYATQRIDEQAAREKALADCNAGLRRNLPNPSIQQQCFIYAVGNEVVWTIRPPPMPDQPWVAPIRSLPATKLDLANMPLPTEASRQVLQYYLPAPGAKSAVISRRGVFHFASNRSSENAAMRAALQRCGFVSQRACVVYAVNDEVVLRLPETMKPVDILVPEDLPNLSASDRQRINVTYVGGGDWRALAVGRSGRVGIAVRQGSEQLATRSAVHDCIQAGGVDCAVIAVGAFIVTQP